MSANRRFLVAGLLAAVLLGVAALAVRGSFLRRDPTASALAAAGLPRDLADYTGQLRSLRLPSHVVERLEDLRWLSDRLTSLSIDRIDPNVLSRLPSGLRELTVREAWELPSLEGLPRKLERLTFDDSSIGELRSLPTSLRALSLGGVERFTIGGLPAGLRELRLRNTQVRDLRGAPEGLTSLTLVSRDVASLDGVPPGVRAVTLRHTFVSTLEPLPADLHALELVANPLIDPLELEDLPSYLVELGLEQQDLGRLGGLPPSLRRLHVSECDGAEGLLLSLPRTLTHLEVAGLALPKGCWLPPDLRSLTLRPAYGLDDSCLPEDLEELFLEGAEASMVGSLGAPLERLGLVSPGDADLDDLGALPASLRYLSLDYTDSDVQRLATETPSLVSLHFWGSPLVTLPDLPETLEVLDLSGSLRLRSLGRLGERSRELRVLLVSGSRLSALAEVPDSVVELDVSDTPLRSLQGLPAGLEKLTLSRGQLDRLDGLPDTVREIVFVD